ncbi:MAG: nucleotidyltransferase domain-containing protein [Candidatus Bathyarchaeia archaeon]
MSRFDLLIESAKDRAKWLSNWMEVGARIKEIAKKYYPDCKTIVFGSIVENKYSINSDIDILVIRELGNSDEKIRVEVLRALPKAPVELHFATHDQFNRWYRRFIDAQIEL